MPIDRNFLARRDYGIREDMWVAPDELLANRIGYFGDGERAALGSEFGVKDDLKQDIAQFVAKILVVVSRDRVERFVGLFDQIRL